MKTTALLVTIFIAVVGRFMADEVKAWFAWLHGRVRRTAVAMLPKELRERYDEEWERELEEYPGEILKLIYSVGLFSAAAGIRKADLKIAADPGTRFSSLKRLCDIALSSIVIVLLAPLLFIIAIAIKLETPGPVFYVSKRIGKKGRVFDCIKFRTIVRRTEGAVSAGRRDPRVTRLGRLLRKYSLDELPQFLNVLLGDMSLVGPRPPMAYEVGEHELDQQRRFDVRPGITGLWQISGRQERRLIEPLNEVYAKHWSFWLDFQIIIRSLAVAAGDRTDSRPSQGAPSSDEKGD
jgi:lipopolysaccharide/colanic/teichoic acid biosynthesis glycosyltransferase